MFDFSNPLFRDPKGLVYKICVSDSFLYEIQRAVSTAMYKFVPDVLSLEESPPNSNTSFHRQKECLRQTVSYTHTPPPYLQRYIYMYTHRERGVCSGCYGSLCTKSETLTVSSSKGKSVLLLISSFLLPSNCLCPFILQAASNSCQVSQAETEMFPTSCSHQK